MKKTEHRKKSELTDQEICRYAVSEILNDRMFPYIPCLVCGGRAGFIGVFLPNPEFARRIGIPKGKQQVIGYKICERCAEEPGVTQQVESLMLQDMEVQ
jgi:hypothetical protein